MSNQPAWKPERNRLLIAYYSEGHTYRECGDKFGITGSRAQQLIWRAQWRAVDEIVVRGVPGQKLRERFRAWDQERQEKSDMNAPQQRGGIGADVPEEIAEEFPESAKAQAAQDPPQREPSLPRAIQDAVARKALEADIAQRIEHAEQRLAQMEGWAAQANQSFNVLAARVDVVRKQQDINSQRALALDFAIKAAPTQKGKPIVALAREFLAFLGEGNPQMVEPVADGVDHSGEAQTTH